MTIEVLETPNYARWFASLRDERAKARVLARVRRLSVGGFGDAKSVGGGVSELRIDYGPGYRVYFARRGAALVLLLMGGDKSRQRADIAKARELTVQWKGE
jgi:putative addiction module killer protein